MKRSFVIAALMMTCLVALSQCHKDKSSDLILCDFESDAELDQLRWNCHTLYFLSEEHATHGLKSLKMELYPSEYPGLNPILKKSDWRSYRQLSFDIYNPHDHTVQIAVRIDDREDYADYEDRYNAGFILKPGMNTVTIPCSALVTSGTGRQLDLKNIYQLLIFLVNPEKKVTLYLDYVRLIRMS